jgi:hypothetical protein
MRTCTHHDSLVGGEVVVVSSGEPCPLGDRSAYRGLPLSGPELAAITLVLRPAFGRVLPALLAAVNRHIQHAVAAAHGLAPAAGRPISLEDAIPIAQVAGLHPETVSTGASHGEAAVGLLRHRVPRHHVPAHELAVAVALVVRALAEDGEGHVARVQVRQLQRLAGVECAAFALVGSWAARMPHVPRGEQLGTALERVEQRHRAGCSNERRSRVDLDHWESPTSSGDCVALAGVRFLSHAELVDLLLESLAVDGEGFRGHDVFRAVYNRKI